MSQELVLLPEVQARRALADRSIRLHVLAPYGSAMGCGTLRVLRLKTDEREVELTVGYESYEP
ncbi:MAG TPA: hypothetical protein VMU38_02370 [Candidatus Binatia bacterium]|nr:hypothetical protein [Candidatus Binatia bacterium]